MKIIMIASENFYIDSDGFEKAEEFLKQMEEAIETDPDWKNGKHMGDCTNVSTMCARCCLERWDRDTINALKYFKNEGE